VGKPLEVLLVEDDEADVELTKESLNHSKLFINLNVVGDGVSALEYLRNSDTVKPDLIILDLNMPKKDGHETLREIRSDEDLKGYPVVMLTTSDAMEDVKKCYRDGANSYVTKPVDFEQFRKIVQDVTNFWFTVVRLPN